MNDRKKSRSADQRPKRWFNRTSVNEQETGEVQSNGPSASAIERTLDTSADNDPNENAEALELSDSLVEFAARSSAELESGSDDFSRFDLVGDPPTSESVEQSTVGPGIGSPNGSFEAHQTNVEGTAIDGLGESAQQQVCPLIDTSKWFEHGGSETLDELLAEQRKALSEGDFFESAFADTENTSGATKNGNSFNGCEVHYEQLESRAEQGREPARDERRKHPREDSSDLVWVEYFNSSMECAGKEAARVENIGAGGMRLAIKSAPPEIERVIVSYAYRGFESCSVVRSRYQGENGQERLCLEFVNKEWKASATGESEQSRGNHGSPRKILLADDDSAFRKILGNILTKAGYDVVLAEDGERAVEMAATENPDLVITDGLMPKLHGFQVCKAVKSLNPRTKVIMLSAVYTTPNYKWEARTKFGADELITKPCQIADLLRAIETHMPASYYVA